MEKKTPRPYTPESFALAAKTYLERFPCSEARCELVLTLKFIKRRQPVEKEWINTAIAMGKEAGFLDDARFGRAVFEGYIRQGLPPMRIRQKLMVKQLPEDQINALLAELPSDTEARRTAVDRYARRKRLGRHNPRHPDPKDYARLRRAGFGHDVVQWILNDDAAD